MNKRDVTWTLKDALDKADGKDGLIYQREALAVLAAEVRRLQAELGRVRGFELAAPPGSEELLSKPFEGE